MHTGRVAASGGRGKGPSPSLAWASGEGSHSNRPVLWGNLACFFPPAAQAFHDASARTFHFALPELVPRFDIVSKETTAMTINTYFVLPCSVREYLGEEERLVDVVEGPS